MAKLAAGTTPAAALPDKHAGLALPEVVPGGAGARELRRARLWLRRVGRARSCSAALRGLPLTLLARDGVAERRRHALHQVLPRVVRRLLAHLLLVFFDIGGLKNLAHGAGAHLPLAVEVL
eukprot:CAMPEP_0171179402 /NCGR_PEP_ID=MMETSP0790-20130122/13238_1 /TAXON_ID=2925 /ORGANISM="Alexandrium catenella, Strain OF101" /LENGTH=120 /DNA_ID=CAMNT_0011644333 /DNA_START=235 /DNA_END=597 /DNA_ORIENTATION=-